MFMRTKHEKLPVKSAQKF